ncbi:MAG: molybdate ABC transporter permease subunit [Oscillatoriales cyanobacterium SM2_2_1]|nr:molybdate ABC transporter permease subunit [Oscillatoriales cyanobacterium SM2_2_1]
MTVDTWDPLWISLRASGIALVITSIAGIASAYWMLGYRGRWKSLIESIFIAPLVLPPTVIGFLLLLLFGRNGPIGKLTSFFDFTIIFTWYAVVVTASIVSFPLMYKTALGAFEQVDPNLLLVAKTLGASKWDIFWQVLLPLSIPGILAGTTLAFARSLGEFGATLMLAGNIPGQTQTVPMAIYFAVEAGDTNQAWLWVTVILAISLSGIVAINVWETQHKLRIQGKIHRGKNQRVDSLKISTHPDNISLESLGKTSQSCLEQVNLDESIHVNIQKQLALFDLDVFFSARHETLGVLGASGSGKSMTLHCIAGIDTPTQGRIVLNGQTLYDSERGINLPSHQRKVGLVFQSYALFPHMTVAQNIAFGLQHLSAKRRSLRVKQQLTFVQLEAFGDRYPHQLSGGQQQRVALARALATEPDILLLDEPFAALDTHLRHELEKQLIKVLSCYGGITLFVTHNLDEAYRVCQKLLVLDRGSVVANGEKQEIFDRPHTLAVAKLTGCKNFSCIKQVGHFTLHAIDWNCTLQTVEAISSCHTHVGIRAHHITFLDVVDRASAQPNTFLSWIVWKSETPHRMTLYLKLEKPPLDPDDYHLQAEVPREKWEQLKDRPMPMFISLGSERLILTKS